MIAVIGDIHGCFNTFRTLIDKVRTKYNDIKLYSVGDLIDRGNFSVEVVDYIISEGIVFTPGNHDYMFYYFIKEPTSEMGCSWIYNGFEKTITSYNDRFDKIAVHLKKIINAPLFLNLDDCFISHAGISKYYKSKVPKNFKENPDSLYDLMASEIQNSHGILWTRDELMDLGKLQIVGHTRQQDVEYIKKNNAAYIDTSVYTGNKLSAVIVDDNQIVDILSVRTFEKDIE